MINDAPAVRVDNMPYGGVKLSGFGREGIRFLNACQDVGMVIINASPYISEWMLLERVSGP